MFAGHPCEIFLIKKQLFSRKMLNKRKLKYNFGTECILLKTVYNNREYIYVKTKSEIYIRFKSAFFIWNWVDPTSLGSRPLIKSGILILILISISMMMMMMMMVTMAPLAATQCREYLLLIEERPSWQLTFQQFTMCGDGGDAHTLLIFVTIITTAVWL